MTMIAKGEPFAPRHFNWRFDNNGVAAISPARLERKSPLPFESCAELRDAAKAKPQFERN